MNVSKIKIAIKNSLTLTLTLLTQERIQIGVMKVVNTMKRIDMPSIPSLNLRNYYSFMMLNFALISIEKRTCDNR